MKILREYLSEDSWLDTFQIPDRLIPNEEKFEELWSLHPTIQNKVMIRGHLKTMPRFQQSYIKDYWFSGMNSLSKSLPKPFKPYLDYFNDLEEYGGKFNQVLLNWYQNGHNYIGSHRDDESQLRNDSPIVTLSLGAVRKFRVRKKWNKEVVKDIDMTPGLFLVMGGKFQKEFKHEVVKISGKKGERTGRRISITLRQFR